MKILIIGAESGYSIETYYLKYLKRNLGSDNVDLFKSQNIFIEYYNKNIINKIIYRAGFSKILKRINTQLINKIDSFLPDVVLVFKGMEIFPSTLKLLKSKSIKLVNYNPDHPFEFHGRGSGNKNILNGIPFYDLYLTYSKKIQNRLQQNFKVKSGWLPFGFEVDESEFNSIEKVEEKNRICFLGNPDRERAEFIIELSKNDLPITVYGHDWGKWIKTNKSIEINGPVYQKDFLKVIRSYRVQLNLFRPHNENSHNMRSFEVPSVGGIMLAPLTEEHSYFFKADKEAFYFENFSSCLSKCKYLLNLPASDVTVIRNDARKRSLNSNYSYQQRVVQFIELINSI